MANAFEAQVGLNATGKINWAICELNVWELKGGQLFGQIRDDFGWYCQLNDRWAH